MGKLESGEVVLENVPFDLPELIHEITDVLEKQAEERGIVLHREYGRLPHPRLVGSPLHVKRLLMNVLSNAIKYNREKGRVMLDCFELSCTGDKAQICFVCADTGIGMSEEFQQRMFEPLRRKRGARSVYGGTGLGMSITKSLWIRWAVPSGWKASRAWAPPTPSPCPLLSTILQPKSRSSSRQTLPCCVGGRCCWPRTTP